MSHLIMERYLKLDIFRGSLILLFITLIYLHSFLFNLEKAISLDHGDTFHIILTFRHYFDVLLSGSLNGILEVPMFYGFEKSLLFSEPFIFEAIFGLLFYILTQNILVTYNLVTILTIFASLLSMFFLAHYLTKSLWPSVLAAVIYVLNPFTLGHFPDNLHYFSLQWIPLIFLFFERGLRESNKSSNFFWMFIFLSLQLLTSMTYTALLTVVLPIYGLGRLGLFGGFRRLGEIIRKGWLGIAGGLGVLGIVVVGLGWFYTGYYSEHDIDRDLEATRMFSPWVSDLFFTGPNNLIYGGLRGFVQENWPSVVLNYPELAERNLFWGITPIVLFILSFFWLKKDKESGLLKLSVIMIIICTLLSFGPTIRFSESFYIPGPYEALHAVHPLIQNLRVASRFTIFNFLFLGLICAFTLREILKSRQGRKAGGVWAAAIVGLVVLEYWVVPFKFYEPPLEVKQIYQSLEEQKDVEAVLELPMGNLLSRIGHAHNQFVETKYMLFASTLHSKKLFNGYSSYIPPLYGKRLEYLTINFPNPVKLNKLKEWGVGAIVIHEQEYFDEVEYERIKNILKELKVPLVKETDNLVLFNLANWDISLLD